MIITVLFEIWCHWLTPFFTQTAEDHDVNKPEGFFPCTLLVRWTILVRKMSTNVWNWTISDVISQEHRNILRNVSIIIFFYHTETLYNHNIVWIKTEKVNLPRII